MMLSDEIFKPTQLPSSEGPSGAVEALFRQRWKFIITAALVFGLSIIWTFATPKRFSSDMVLLVQNARANEIISSGQAGGTAVSNDVSEEQLNSEVAVLNSGDILDQLIAPGWGERVLTSVPRLELLAHEKAVRNLRSNLDVSLIRSSHAIEVKVVATTPEGARQTAARLLDLFLRKQRDLGRLPGATKVFEQQAEEYKAHLEIARRDLADYQNRHGFVSLGAQESTLQAKIQDLETEARQTDVLMSDLQQRVSAERQQVAASPERMSTIDQSSTATGAIDQLNVLLVNLQNRKAELLMKYKPTDRLVAEVEQQIENTRAGIRQATEKAPHEVSTDINPLRQASQRDLSANLVTISGLRARRASLASQILTLQSDLNSAELETGNYETLQQRVTELQNAYQAYVQKRDNSLVSDLMDQQRWLNVAVVQYPTFSLTPSHPRPVRDLSFGLLTALLLGGCAVFFFETLRQQVSTPAELEAASRYRVLATVAFAPLRSGTKVQLTGPGDLTISVPEDSAVRYDESLSPAKVMERHA